MTETTLEEDEAVVREALSRAYEGNEMMHTDYQARSAAIAAFERILDRLSV